MLEQLFRSKRMAEVVNGLMQSFAEEQDLVGVSSSDLFEIFTAYCVVGQDYRGDFEPEELRTGGPHDLGIDAFAVTINGRLYTDADGAIVKTCGWEILTMRPWLELGRCVGCRFVRRVCLS
jgi:hypothetical protein